MTEMDLYYRALRDYRKTVSSEKAHTRFLQAIAKAAAREDKLESIRTKCHIDEEWVATIERYLPFVENAIREDRQFIRQEGETVPIEKAKKVSKASVSHLARHSDMITHLPEKEGDPLLPDKIFITENENNYAVYENRFLYMLLCYTRDFVELRYTKISELGNTYRGNLRIKKHVELGKRTINFDTTLSEVAKNDPRFSGDRLMHDMIERLEAIRVQVSALLLTPLMNEVSKAPMLRPPITRTNVLRMDNNFKNAVALFDYLSSYEGDGYTIEEIKKSFSPFPDQMGAELFESIPMLTFLLYKYGNDLEGELKASYEHAKNEEALAEAQRKSKELEALRQRIRNGEGDMEEYLLRMESHAKDLEQTVTRLHASAQKLESKLERVTGELAWQQKIEQQLKESVDELRFENGDLKNTIENDRVAHEQAEEKLREECAQTVQKADLACQEQLAQMRAECHAAELDMNEKIAAMQQTVQKEKDAQLALNARLHAYQSKHGEQIDADLTEKENFLLLEKERAWFEKLFQQTWSQTKKRIRKDLLWKKRSKDSNSPEIGTDEGTSKDD